MKRSLCVVVLCGILFGRAVGQDEAEGHKFFEEKIRPILASTCLKCHSVAGGKVRGGLSFDSRSSVLKGGDHGPAIVPGDPSKSRLIKLINYDDDVRMPPSGKLTDQQIASFTQWIKMGAPDPRNENVAAAKLSGMTQSARAHWAYQPVRKPAPPAVKGTDWIKTPIDAFILAKLEERGLEPSAPADKATLLRRATFDLTGLPPTAEEVQAFLDDPSPDAFSKVVDRLLASPHYGERWGRHWLELVRYADTAGSVRYEVVDYRTRFAWTYRDYVIESLNRDTPYDRFILEQLAADKLDLGGDRSTLAALGFITVGERFGVELDEETINERIDTVSKAFFGLTVSCARCHDHKFDPIPTADYYSLYGVFMNSVEPEQRPVIGKPNAHTPDYFAQIAALVKRGRDGFYKAIENYGTLFRRQPATYALQVLVSAPEETTMMKPSAMSKAPALDKTLMKGRWGWMRQVQDAQHPVWGPLARFADLPAKYFSGRSEALASEIFANVERRTNPKVAALFKTPPASLQDVEARYNALFAGLESQFREHLAAMSSATTPPKSRHDAATLQLLETPFAIPPACDLDTLQKLEKATGGWSEWGFDLGSEHGDYNLLELTHPGVLKRAMAVEDEPKPRDARILIRGIIKGEEVPRRFLEILSGPDRRPFKEGSGRLELARAIVSKENPLTARVAVNRIWMHHFGEGFVPTPENLGVMAEKPSHPELLDWLAATFMESGASTPLGMNWSLKKLHRLILLSSVYQQSSKDDPRRAERDPDNRLLWRSNVRRLEYEVFRDSLLVFAGVLDRTIGGQPVNLTEEPYSFRRSVYGFLDRGSYNEILQNFNVSDARLPSSKRATTALPQQALYTMNSPMVADIARRIVARKDIAGSRDAGARIQSLYRILFQRAPTTEELRLGSTFVSELKRSLSESETVTSGGTLDGEPVEPRQKRRDYSDYRQPIENKGTGVPRRPLTAWEQYVQALLFTNEIAFAW